MPNLDRKPLPDRVSLSGITAQGGCAAIWGLPFLGMGAFTLASVLGYLDATSKSFDDARTSGIIIGGIFVSVGLWLIAHGIAGYVGNALVSRRKSKWPGEPWYWDHPWNAEGVGSSGGPMEQLQGLVSQVLWTLILATITWVAYTTEGWGWLALVAIFDLAILYSWGLLFYKFGRSLQHQRGRLRFRSFPFFLGGSLEVELLGADRLRGFRSLTVSLRCIREAFESGTGVNSKSRMVVSYQIYEDGRTLTPDANPITGPDLRISFPLPSGDYSTRLGKRPPQFWELEITADMPGADYAATFLVPVYARSETSGTTSAR